MESNSINDILNMIESGNTTSTLEIIKSEMENQVSLGVLSMLWLDSGVVNLSLELVRKAMGDCNKAIELDENNVLAYFVLGVCYLWKNNEKNAIMTWKIALEHPGPIITHTVLKSLIENCSIRQYVEGLRFDVKSLFEFHDFFDPDSINSSYGIEIALKYLKSKKYTKAITYFTINLHNNPSNYDALRYRGVAYCQNKQYNEAVKDLSAALAIKETDEVLQYRATAYAMSGDTFLAIQDLSYVIENNPIDYETLATRGTLNMWRGCFSLALNDFQQIPTQCYKSITWVSYAETLYALGDLGNAKEMLTHVDEANSRRAFLEFLIARDEGDLTRASNSIMQLAASYPIMPVLRATGEQMLDAGMFANASTFLEMAREKKPEDIDLLRVFAVSKFCEHSFKESLDICNKITIESTKFMLSIDVCKKEDDEKFNSPLISFAQKDKPYDVAEKAIKTSEWILFVTTHLLDSINTITPTALMRKGSLPEYKGQKLESVKLKDNAEAFKNYVKLADSIGSKVLIRAKEVMPSPRLIRGLGISTLYLASAIKNLREKKENDYWKDYFDIVLAILSLSDPRKIVGWCDGSIGSSSFSTDYFLSEGERISPRFADFINLAIGKIRESKKLGNIVKEEFQGPSNVNISTFYPLNTIDDLYSSEQADFATVGQIPGFKIIPKPSILLRKCINGFDLIVSPRNNIESAWQVTSSIDNLWKQFMNDEEPLQSISAMVLLIWCNNQFTYHSVEIGHILIHAAAIAMYGSDVPSFGSDKREIFMEQMINPDLKELSDELENLFAGRNQEEKIAPEVLSYVDSSTTVSDILTMLSMKV